MSKKVKNVILIVVVISIVLGSNWLYYYPQLYRRAQNYPYEGDKLTEAFLEQFPRDYDEILRKEQDGLVVFLGRFGKGGQGYYACYEKALFFDRWRLVDNGSLGQGSPSDLVRANFDIRPTNRVYLSLNTDGISKIVVTTKGREREVIVDSDRIFAVVMEDDFDDIVFYTKMGDVLSEAEFLKHSAKYREML